MLELIPSEIDRPLIETDLTAASELAIAAFLPIVVADLGLAGRLLGLTPGKAASLLRSDLGPKISGSLHRVLALSDSDLALLIDAIALRLAAWRRARPLAEPTPETLAAAARLTDALTR